MRLIIDVGGTKTLIVAVDGGGKELHRRRFPTDAKYPEFKGHLESELQAIIEKLGQPLEGIAIALPGVINYQSMVVEALGNRDWTDVKLYDYLMGAFGVPVVLDNDGNFGALGEARHGAGRGHSVVLYVTVSTGIGTGVAVDGHITRELARSEGGQQMFRRGHKFIKWERFASGGAFYRHYKRYGSETPGSEVKIWQEYAENVALGLHNMIAIIQPDIVLVGGSMGEHWPKYAKYVIKHLEEFKSPVTVLPVVQAAQDPDDAVIRGGMEAISDELA